MERAMQAMEVDDAYRAFLAERRERVLAHMADACARAGRDLSDVELVAVTKTVDVPQVLAAWQLGYRNFGENRPQELRRKALALRELPGLDGARLHMIGNLQKNKINQVLDARVSLIHSISSLEIARAVAHRAKARGVVAAILLEVNVVGEASKMGMSCDEARRIAAEVGELEGVELRGLMAMAPPGDPSAARRSFSGLRELRDELERACDTALPVLSCGMSGDFQIAIEEGSTHVRLGRVIFDPAYGFD
jgi:pyridoxal phosphate enzyme (YggS family)